MRFTPQFLDELTRPPSGLGGGGPAREAAEVRARVEGAVAVQQGEDAVVLRQRPEAGVVRLLLRQERQHLRLHHADRGRAASRRRSSGSPPMAGMPLPKFSKEEEARDEKRKTLHDVMELAAKFFEATLAGRGGAKARGYLADRGARCRDAAEVPPRLCAGRALRAEGASRRAGRAGRGHGRDRPADRRRRHSGALRPLPRPRDVPDHRLSRPHHRLRRPRARRPTRRRNISTRRRRRSFTRARTSTTAPPRARPCTTARR